MAERPPPTRQQGEWTLHAISDGLFRLDGGAMFGTVPKMLWERVKPADSENRIDLCATCLVARGGGLTVLVEGGIGRKHDERARRIYGLDPITSIEEELGRLGLGPEEVDHVVLTHLHFDHAGGLTVRDGSGEPRPCFPRARHHVHAVEWEAARYPNARSRASYLPEDWMPIAEAGLLDVHDDEGPFSIVPGIRAERVGGHTRGLSIVRIAGAPGAAEVVYVGDLVPTGAHLPVPWIMGYDLDPVRQVDLKEQLLPRWAESGALVVFPHETRYPWARVARDGRGAFRAAPVDEGWLDSLRRVAWPEMPGQGPESGGAVRA